MGLKGRRKTNECGKEQEKDKQEDEQQKMQGMWTAGDGGCEEEIEELEEQETKENEDV